VLLFCLVNPFAGWAYLATSRARWDREQASLSDTLKRKRLVVLPLVVLGRTSSQQEWFEAMRSGLGGFDVLEIVPHAESPGSLDAERDPLALGANLGADLVVDASVSVVAGEQLIIERLLRIEDGSVLGSESFAGEPEDFGAFCDEIALAVLRTLMRE
jgi:TolB-like protein